MFREATLFGVTILMYDVFNYLAAIVLVVCFLSRAKEIAAISPLARTKKRPVLIALIEIGVFQTAFYLLFSYLNPHFGTWFTHGNANYYGNLTAWIISCAVIPVLFKMSPLKTSDILSPALPLSLFVAQLACFFNGCCWSYEVAHSWYYSQYHNRYESPVQLVEAGVALLLFFFLLWQKKRRRRSGFAFPLYLTIYSVSRFFTEFLRGDLPDVLGPLDAYQVMSIVFTIIGAVLLWLVWKYGERIDAYYEKKLSAAENTGGETGGQNQT